MIIDFHTHIFPQRMKANREEFCRCDPHFAMLYGSPKAKMVTADELVTGMDESEIDRSVVLGYCWSSQELCVEHNSYILESVARYPQRLIGFCTVQTEPIESAIREVERCARAGARGIGELRPDLLPFDFTSEQSAPLFAETLQKYRLILLTHASEPVGHRYPGKGAATPDKLYPFISRFSELTLVCAHWGGGLPFYALMPEVKKSLENVYFDTAASPFLYNPNIYRQLIDIIGAAHILFGTDYPLMPQSRVIKEIKTQNLPEDTVDLILSGNATRILQATEKG
jgi:predicted TIM-barrel fold metal-dependent hydrolase